MNRLKNQWTLGAMGVALLLAAGLAPRAAAAAWYSGGSYDGYGAIRDRGSLDMPQVKNDEGGATNLTPNSAFLNGMLLSTGAGTGLLGGYWTIPDTANSRVSSRTAAALGETTRRDMPGGRAVRTAP